MKGVDLSFNATVAAQVFHFVLLLVLLRIFAYRPLLKVLDDRRRFVAAQVEAAEHDRERAGELYRRGERALESARGEAGAIIVRAEREAREQAGRIIEEARAAAGRERRRAAADIDRELAEARVLLQRELAGLVLQSTEKVVGLVMDGPEHRRLVEQAVGEAGDEHWRIDV